MDRGTRASSDDRNDAYKKKALESITTLQNRFYKLIIDYLEANIISVAETHGELERTKGALQDQIKDYQKIYSETIPDTSNKDFNAANRIKIKMFLFEAEKKKVEAEKKQVEADKNVKYQNVQIRL